MLQAVSLWFLSLPATVKLGFVLLAVVSAMRVRVPMGVALLIGAGLLSLLFSLSAGGFVRALGAGLASNETVFLLLVVVGILVLSGSLNVTGQLKRIIESFKALVGESRLALVAFPSLIGLLPMPGGAIFSAPMVEAAVQDFDVGSARSTAANYWFRHVWEYWLPLYPGMILALTLSQAPAGKFMLMQLPMTFWALASGYVVILHRIRLGNERRRDYSARNVFRFLHELTPILIVVGCVAFLDSAAEAAAGALGTKSLLVRRMPMLLGLIVAGGWLVARRGLAWSVLGRLFFKKNVLEMVFLAAGVFMFKSVLERCGAVEVLRDEFAASHVPLAAAVALLPFIAGLVTGIAIGYVGASFPLVIVLLSALPESQRLPYYCLAYGFGYAGMMLSPVHLCLVMTNEYFKSALLRVYAYLAPLCFLSAALTSLLFLLYRAL